MPIGRLPGERFGAKHHTSRGTSGRRRAGSGAGRRSRRQLVEVLDRRECRCSSGRMRPPGRLPIGERTLPNQLGRNRGFGPCGSGRRGSTVCFLEHHKGAWRGRGGALHGVPPVQTARRLRDQQMRGRKSAAGVCRPRCDANHDSPASPGLRPRGQSQFPQAARRSLQRGLSPFGFGRQSAQPALPRQPGGCNPDDVAPVERSPGGHSWWPMRDPYPRPS